MPKVEEQVEQRVEHRGIGRSRPAPGVRHEPGQRPFEVGDVDVAPERLATCNAACGPQSASRCDQLHHDVADRGLLRRSIRPAAPKSISASRPSCSSITFPGCGSAWKTRLEHLLEKRLEEQIGQLRTSVDPRSSIASASRTLRRRATPSRAPATCSSHRGHLGNGDRDPSEGSSAMAGTRCVPRCGSRAPPATVPLNSSDEIHHVVLRPPRRALSTTCASCSSTTRSRSRNLDTRTITFTTTGDPSGNAPGTPGRSSRGQRLRVELGEDLVERRPQLRLEQLARHRRAAPARRDPGGATAPLRPAARRGPSGWTPSARLHEHAAALLERVAEAAARRDLPRSPSSMCRPRPREGPSPLRIAMRVISRVAAHPPAAALHCRDRVRDRRQPGLGAR